MSHPCLAALQAFRDVAACSGQASQERKKGLVVKLLAASKGNEAGYIMRSLQVRGPIMVRVWVRFDLGLSHAHLVV